MYTARRKRDRREEFLAFGYLDGHCYAVHGPADHRTVLVDNVENSLTIAGMKGKEFVDRLQAGEVEHDEIPRHLPAIDYPRVDLEDWPDGFTA